MKSSAKLELPSKKKANATRTQINTPEDLKISNTYVMDRDVHQAYYALTDKKADFEDITSKKTIEEIIDTCTTEGAVKGDEFEIEGTYYKDDDSGFMQKKETKGLGEKAASSIAITKGANKGKRAIILHHAEIEGTIDIIKNIYEIS